MKKRKVLDSYALLAYLKKEDNYQRVKNLLISDEFYILMNEINLGETFYILARERGLENAQYFIETMLPSLPIHPHSNIFEDVLGAATIKANYTLSYADCFAIHTALKENAILVTGDPEFKKVEKMIKIDWL